MFSENELNALKAKVAADDPMALYTYAKLLSENGKSDEAEKYYEFAAQLGQPDAAAHMADVFAMNGDKDRAEVMYKIGAKAGLINCSVKLAILRLPTNEHAAISELEELAEAGIPSAAAALAEYYKERGNHKQYAYWRSLSK